MFKRVSNILFYNKIRMSQILMEKKNINEFINKKIDIPELVKEKNIKEIELSNPTKLSNHLKERNNIFLENFELLELIGEGSESYVYKIKIKKNQKIVTCKIVKREMGKGNLTEYNISKKLKNKNIINIYGDASLIEGELDCLMMEYAKYGNLRDFQTKVLKRKVLSESLLCYIAYQVLNGLKFMHMNKIAHFDLKPQNLIIDEFLNIKIIDFSVSINYRNINKKTIKLPFRGTKFYIPPEVINKETIKVNDLNKIDLYSLGVVLYHLAFGNYPYNLLYEDSNDYDKIYKKVMKDWEINEKNDFSLYFIDFLKKLLSNDINKRININDAMNHYWIKGADILFDEREKTFNANSFLIFLMTDSIKSFNNYLGKKI